MTGDGKKIARYRLMKRLGIIGLASTASFAAVLLLLSLLPQGNAAFTIRIDNPLSNDNGNFKMHLTGNPGEAGESDKGVNYASGEPLKTVEQTTATHVEQYLSYKQEHGGLRESQNMGENDLYEMGIARNKVEDPSDLALVYTVYLTNESELTSTTVHYGVDVEAYENPQLLESARILVQLEDESGYKNIYYGKERNQSLPFTQMFTNGDPENNNREIIAGYKTDEETSTISVLDTWDKTGNDGYCRNFNDINATKRLVNDSLEIKNKIRFTFVCYFETKDPDQFPSTGYILLSLHFGI